jgi:branched-subunit amino acid transport protein
VNDIQLWLTIILAALVSFSLRYLPMKLLGKQRLAPWLERALRYVPAATLSGLVLPALLLQNNKLALSFSNDRLIAGILAAVIAYFSRNALFLVHDKTFLECVGCILCCVKFERGVPLQTKNEQGL